MPRCGKLSSEDVRRWYEEMEKNKILGEISFPTKKSTDGFYHVWVKDPDAKGGRRQFKAKDLSKLKEKVYFRLTEYKKFSNVFEMAMDEKLKYVKNPEKRMSVLNTITVYNSCYNRYFADTELANIKVDQITKEDLEAFVLLNLERYDVRKRAFMNLRSILRMTLRYAYENYMVSENIYERVNFDKYNDMLENPVPIRNRVHSDDDYQRILGYIHATQEENPKYLVPYALEFQMLTGMRRGEVPPLKWSDISDGVIRIYQEQISVRKNKYNSHEHTEIVEHTKTYKDRVFPVTTEIEQLLAKIKGLDYDSEFIFPSKRNKIGCIGNQAIYKFYRKACRDLGIEISKDEIKGTHSFRRNAITRTANITGDMVLTSQLYGNSPTVAATNYYTGINVADAREMLEKIG